MIQDKDLPQKEDLQIEEEENSHSKVNARE